MVLGIASLDGVVLAQQAHSPVPTLQATSRLVLVDVIARDKHGPVEGLTQADFQISERLKASGNSPQKISFFQEVEFGRIDPSTLTNQHPVSALASRSESAPPVTILLLDAMNTNPSGQREVIHKLDAMIDAIPPDSRAAIFILGGQLTAIHGVPGLNCASG